MFTLSYVALLSFCTFCLCQNQTEDFNITDTSEYAISKLQNMSNNAFDDMNCQTMPNISFYCSLPIEQFTKKLDSNKTNQESIRETCCTLWAVKHCLQGALYLSVCNTCVIDQMTEFQKYFIFVHSNLLDNLFFFFFHFFLVQTISIESLTKISI